MINGMMTLSGAWHKLRDDPILKFLIVVAVVLRHGHLRGADDVDQDRQRAVALHRLDHRPRALPARSAGSASSRWARSYYLIPRLFGQKQMYSVPAIELHFWIATIGIVLYIAAMWIAGVMQGLMWRAINADGTLTYTFVESVKATYPFYVIRLLGGLLYLGRHADDGLEHLDDRARRPARSTRRVARCRQPPGSHA